VDGPEVSEDRIEVDRKNVLVSPHPDDETFSMAEPSALAEKGNQITMSSTPATTGSLTSDDPRTGQVRRAEEEEACRVLGIGPENLIWLGYDDGDLEYADPQRLRGEVCRLMKKIRPDAVFTADPGTKWEQWHKTDHRMAAILTKDAFIASEWHLYYPQHLLDEGLKPYPVPVAYYYYSQEPNYEVDITSKFEVKARSSAAHVSQFEPSLSQYTPEMSEETFKQIRDGFAEKCKQGERYVERFRREVLP
jgi:LmbE family N-acetylglucosaminyl deacetylase